MNGRPVHSAAPLVTMSLVVLLLVGGCAATGDTGAGTGRPAGPPAGVGSAAPAGTSGAGSAYADADTMFLRMMVTHHQQALEIVRLAQDRATDPTIRTLAAAIEATQTDELATMKGWLQTQGGQPVSAADHQHHHAGHGLAPATGADDIVRLRAKTGPAFEPALLNLLVSHQHQAAEMARTALTDGSNADVRELARRIDVSRTAQVAQLLTLLGDRPAPTAT